MSLFVLGVEQSWQKTKLFANSVRLFIFSNVLVSSDIRRAVDSITALVTDCGCYSVLLTSVTGVLHCLPDVCAFPRHYSVRGVLLLVLCFASVRETL